MKLDLSLFVFTAAAFAAPAYAQQPAPANPDATRAPVLVAPPSPRSAPTRGLGPGASVTYLSVNPSLSYQVEPVSADKVRLAGWESSGFTVNVDDAGTRIASTGEVTSTASPRLSADSVTIEFIGGQGYLTLTGIKPQPR